MHKSLKCCSSELEFTIRNNPLMQLTKSGKRFNSQLKLSFSEVNLNCRITTGSPKRAKLYQLGHLSAPNCTKYSETGNEISPKQISSINNTDIDLYIFRNDLFLSRDHGIIIIIAVVT